MSETETQKANSDGKTARDGAETALQPNPGGASTIVESEVVDSGTDLIGENAVHSEVVEEGSIALQNGVGRDSMATQIADAAVGVTDNDDGGLNKEAEEGSLAVNVPEVRPETQDNARVPKRNRWGSDSDAASSKNSPKKVKQQAEREQRITSRDTTHTAASLPRSLLPPPANLPVRPAFGPEEDPRNYHQGRPVYGPVLPPRWSRRASNRSRNSFGRGRGQGRGRGSYGFEHYNGDSHHPPSHAVAQQYPVS